ncbi:C-type lectin domain family 12 member B-like [Tachyglossus aculeatus]|uniref:C-type lectin domain family 12 member B-like n=1 Tax=Tachyglossus aculeatus TaxID=9261 RepID=UPI0018F28CDA|nr:C-type lectin domain family 12 member B-like [Tachyglossus aculeatus]
MANEVTYANLKFQDSSMAQRIQKFDTIQEIEHPAPSPAWRWSALGLLTLCLLLLIGLTSLGILFFQEKKNIQQLNGVKENLSLQLDISANISKEKDLIQSDLSDALKKMATKLCRELTRNKQEHACKPCPEKWQWHRDSCYWIARKLNLEKSRKVCAENNSSLVKIDNKEELVFVASKLNPYYWVGLSRNISSGQWVWEDGSTLSPDLIEIFLERNERDWKCAYAYFHEFLLDNCAGSHPLICEKAAGPVKMELVNYAVNMKAGAS